MAPHQADVVLWPQQLHHEVQVLTLLLLLGTLGPLPIVCLVAVGLFFPRGSLHCLRASVSCFSIVLSVLQSQDSTTEHRKALPGRAAGKPLYVRHPPQGRRASDSPTRLVRTSVGPRPGGVNRSGVEA